MRSIARVYVPQGLYAALRDAKIPFHGPRMKWIRLRLAGGLIVSWDDAVLLKLKDELHERSDVRFSLKTFRATFAQLAKDSGVKDEAVSRAMRHASTLTTKRYYARLRSNDAFREIERAFEKPFVRVDED